MFVVFAFELIQPASSLLLAYAALVVGDTHQQALSAPTALVAAVLAAFASGWTAREALRTNKPPRFEDSAINSG